MISGALAVNSATSIQIPKILNTGDYFIRAMWASHGELTETVDSRIFRVTVHALSDLASNYEALLLNSHSTVSSPITPSGQQLLQSWAGMLTIGHSSIGRWSMSVDSTELPNSLELQSIQLSNTGAPIAPTRATTHLGQLSAHSYFADVNGCEWNARSGASDFLSTRAPMKFVLQSAPTKNTESTVNQF